jgi:cobalt/nickel transport system permease protein
MAVLAALIFGLQMLNFPIAAGTSGHFGGGAAAGILLGAWPATIVMSAVLFVQALFFGDGGITTLGANIVNMGIIAPFVAVLVYSLSQKISKSYASKVIGSFAAAFLGVVASAAVVAIELWASNNAQFFAVLGAMVFWHALIGIGEGIITAGLVAYLAKVRPALLGDKPEAADSPKSSLVSVSIVLAALALLATGLSFLASGSPDGLEFVYFEEGVGTLFEESGYVAAAPMSDYLLPGIANETLAGVGAGIIGAIIVGVLLWAIITAIKRTNKQGDKTV